MILNVGWTLLAVGVCYLLFVLAKLGNSAKSLTRQGVRLQKQLDTLKKIERVDVAVSRVERNLNPHEAAKNRRAYLMQRTKKRDQRQRRLVKRLKDLKSQESE